MANESHNILEEFRTLDHRSDQLSDIFFVKIQAVIAMAIENGKPSKIKIFVAKFKQSFCKQTYDARIDGLYGELLEDFVYDKLSQKLGTMGIKIDVHYAFQSHNYEYKYGGILLTCQWACSKQSKKSCLII